MIKHIFITYGILLLLANTVYAQKKTLVSEKKVLILHSQHDTFRWTGKLNNAIIEEFTGAPFDINLYVEYMDTRRFPAKELFPHLYSLYMQKYRHLKFDLILFTDNAALNFLIKYRSILFPGVPVVFCGLNNYTPAMVRAYEGITGILEDFDLKATIDLILTIQPEVKKIGIVSDASYTGRLHRQRFLALKPLFKNLVTFVDIAGLDENQVVREIQKMPEDSAVIVLSYHLDPQGKFFSVREGMDILQKGKRPLYSCWETSLGEGIVGGIITNARLHGRDAARMGIEILKGKKPADIPVESCINLPMFDYRYIKKYNINQSLFPKNSIIINKPDSFYIRYRKTILFILTIFTVMTGLIVGLIINIIKKHQAQKELVRERNFIKTILDTADVLVIVIDLSGKIIVFNRACQKCTGYTAEDIQDIPFWDFFFLPEDKEEARIYVENAGKDFPRESEKYLATKNGQKRLIRWLNSMVVNQKGDTDFIICTGIDITIRKQTEENLILLDFALNHVHEAAFLINEKGNFQFVNEESCRFLGYSREELLDMGVSDVDPGFPSERWSGHWDDLKTQRSLLFESRHKTKDNRIFPIEINANYFVYNGKEYNLALVRDITERKKTEEELYRYRDHLEELVQERTKELEAFAYSVSHDLRAPLRHINGFIDLLRKETETALDEKGRHYMNCIFEGATKMGFLIDDLLAFSRMSRQTMVLKPVKLEDIVSETIREINPDIIGKNIEWKISALPEVYADPSMLSVVLSNLVSNAVKFSRTREQVRIEIGCRFGKKEVVVFVRDNGIGFDQEYADKIFGVFQRLHGTNEYEGTGVGLAIAQRIINRHKGKIWAEGKMDKGATFYFSLPLQINGKTAAGEP